MAATESEHISRDQAHRGQPHAEQHGGMSSEHGGGHYPGMWVLPDPRGLTRDLASRAASMPRAFSLALLASFALLVLGVVGFVARAAMDGFDDRAPWGYYMATFSFVFVITSGAPVAAVAFRFTKSHWRRPLSRVSELFAVVGVFNILLFIPMMLVLPPILNPGPVHGHDLEIRRTIWFEGPIGAPHAWDLAGVVGLAVTAMLILWLSATPDMAERLSLMRRDGTASGLRGRLYQALAGHWYGTKRQWNAQKAGLAMLGAFYFMTLVFVQFIISSDYAQSMIPGYKDAIFPVFYTLTGFQCALGLCLVILYVMRRWGGYGEYYGKSVFWAASKVQLGLTLLWAYHLFSFFITYWYGRLLVEQNVIRYLMGDSYGGVFSANVALSFVIPFLLLLWNPVRRSAWGPPPGRPVGHGRRPDVLRPYLRRRGQLRQCLPGLPGRGAAPGLSRCLGHLHRPGRDRRRRLRLYAGHPRPPPALRVGGEGGRPLPAHVPLRPRRVPGPGQARISRTPRK